MFHRTTLSFRNGKQFYYQIESAVTNDGLSERKKESETMLFSSLLNII